MLPNNVELESWACEIAAVPINNKNEGILRRVFLRDLKHIGRYCFAFIGCSVTRDNKAI